MSSDESGLRRWARRKAEVKRQRGSAAPVAEKEIGQAPSLPGAGNTLPLESRPDDTAAEKLDLPDIETLTADSDFTAFMKEGVPSAVRRLALRKLWASDPMFNVIDEMVEYGEDYTKATLMGEAVKSAWRPGKGYARDETEAEDESGSEAESIEPATASDDRTGQLDRAQGDAAKDNLDGCGEELLDEDPELG